MNRLFYGDNVAVLRANIAAESVDLIYLDPPFNSNASYNVLFRAPSGEGSQAQIEAFEDTWHWNDTAELAFDEVMKGAHSDTAIMLQAMRAALGDNDMMAYLAMMAVRLIELHRVLKPTGSLYLHCDPTASHYLKILLDAVFTPRFFINEITWRRTSAHSDAKRYASVHDTLLLYSKGPNAVWNTQYEPYTAEYIKTHFVHVDEDGRVFRRVDLRSPHPRPNLTYDYEASNGITYKPHPNGWAVSKEKMEELDRTNRLFFPQKTDGRLRRKLYLEDSPGVPLTDVWTDIKPIFATADERLGYPTQKPASLLERIIAASSNEGDTILDPFCGCGTTIHAAQKLKRQWTGIDITHLAIALVERRLTEAFPGIEYKVHGVPQDEAGARDLAKRDKHQFQMWIAAKAGAQPYKGGKKGMDRGIDGYLHFRDADKKPQFAIVSVKGGEHITTAMVRDLKGTMQREKAAMGLFLTLNAPTREMSKEAASAGRYETGGMSFPKLQILTAADIIEGKRPQVPFGFSEGFKKAAREEREEQPRLL